MSRTMHFPMRPYPGVDETAVSFASRYAAINGFVSMAHWCDLVGFKAFDFASGIPEAIRWLCSLDGGDTNRFAETLVGRGDDFRLNGERLRRGDLRRQRLRVCACCVADDLDVAGYPEHVRPYGRVLWQIGALRSCHLHDVALREVDTCDAGGALAGIDFTVAIRRHIPHLYDAADDDPVRPPSSRETYFRDRLKGTRGHACEILDRMPFYAAARACEVVGSVALDDPKARVEHLSDDERHDAADRGYEIVSAGPEALDDLMRSMIDRVLIDPTARWGIRPMLGSLHDSFAHRNDDPAYDPIRRIVAAFASRTIPLEPDERLFGVPVGKRRLHSIRSASMATGIHPKTLRKRLSMHGIISSSTAHLIDDRVIFPAEALDSLPDATQPVLDLAKLGRHLGIPRVHLALIGHSGMISSVRGPGDDGEGRFGFPMDEVERFREALFTGSTEVSEPPIGTADLATVRRRVCRGILEVLEIVRSHPDLTKYRLRDRRDYGSLLLVVDEVKAKLMDEDHGGVPIYKVAQLLGVGDTVTKRLIDHGVLAVRVARNATNRGEQRIVDPATIEEFRRMYVSQAEAMLERGVEREALRRMLRDNGVDPVFDAKAIGATFYRRADLPPI